MKNRLALTIAVLLGLSAHLPAAQLQLEGSWTGGFWRNGAWVAVNLRVPRPNEAASATADVLFPTYGGSENVINVPVENLKQAPGGWHFEIPIRSQKAVFDGELKDDTIAGNFTFDKSQGTFGLNRWAFVPVEALEKYYGAYRVAPDRVISILRGWGHPRTLNYVDYKTGQVGTLWPSSPSAFYSGEGLNVSYPIALRVSFEKDAAGNVAGLTWQSQSEPNVTAQKIAVKEERLTCKNGDVTIGGTLILPAAPGQYPVVIVTPGDYGTHRNQLRLWAHHYVSRGMGAFIFDARGGGESTGLRNSSSFSDLADDVLACVQLLKARADVDPKQIGLFGFSNSAFTVPLAASRSAAVSFLIVQSLVGVVGWQQESYRAETQLRVDGFPENEVKQGAEFMRLKYEVGRTGQRWDRLQQVMEQARSERWLPYTSPPRSLERLRQVYASTMTYDPVPALEKLRIPVLAFWGKKDTYLPVEESVKIFRVAMAGNQAVTVAVYDTGDHSLLVSEKGSPSTGGKEKNFVPGLWDMQGEWLRKHVNLPK